MQLSQSQSSLQQLQHQFSQEREHLRMQLDELQTEHQRREQRLQEVHCCSMRDMEHARQRDLKVGTVKHTSIFKQCEFSKALKPSHSGRYLVLFFKLRDLYHKFLIRKKSLIYVKWTFALICYKLHIFCIAARGTPVHLCTFKCN